TLLCRRRKRDRAEPLLQPEWGCGILHVPWRAATVDNIEGRTQPVLLCRRGGDLDAQVPPGASGAGRRRYRRVRGPHVSELKAWRFSAEARFASTEDGDQTDRSERCRSEERRVGKEGRSR